MCPLIVRLLLHAYTNQTLQVKWNDATSMSFSVTNGVWQGVVMSPHVMSPIYNNVFDLISEHALISGHPPFFFIYIFFSNFYFNF